MLGNGSEHQGHYHHAIQDHAMWADVAVTPSQSAKSVNSAVKLEPMPKPSG